MESVDRELTGGVVSGGQSFHAKENAVFIGIILNFTSY
jgi:hypothetical protein